MATPLNLCPLLSLNSINKPTAPSPGLITHKFTTRKPNWTCTSETAAFRALKATEKKSGTKITSIVCTDCEGNGNKNCSQCLGTGVNSVDHFNGQYKAGGLCWLCRGKREILCGSCNGAGFLGGFLSTCDD